MFQIAEFWNKLAQCITSMELFLRLRTINETFGRQDGVNVIANNLDNIIGRMETNDDLMWLVFLRSREPVVGPSMCPFDAIGERPHATTLSK